MSTWFTSISTFVFLQSSSATFFFSFIPLSTLFFSHLILHKSIMEDILYERQLREFSDCLVEILASTAEGTRGAMEWCRAGTH